MSSSSSEDKQPLTEFGEGRMSDRSFLNPMLSIELERGSEVEMRWGQKILQRCCFFVLVPKFRWMSPSCVLTSSSTWVLFLCSPSEVKHCLRCFLGCSKHEVYRSGDDEKKNLAKGVKKIKGTKNCVHYSSNGTRGRHLPSNVAFSTSL